MPRPYRADYTPFSKADRQAIMSRAGNQCQAQGPMCRVVATVADHVVPTAEGGANDPSNGQALCDPCHAAKTTTEQMRGRQRHSRYRKPVQHPGLQ